MPVPTLRDLAELRADTLSRISENNNSPVAQLPSGTDGTPTEDTNAAVDRYLNEGGQKLARAAYPIVRTGTFAGVSGTASIRFAQLSTTDGSGIWAARKVTVGGTAILRSSRAYQEINTSSTRQVWVPDGSAGLTLYPTLTATASVSVTGFAVPAPMVDEGDQPDWLEADLSYALVYYAAAMICMKAKAVDEVLGNLAVMWMNEYTQVEMMQNARLKANDPQLWAAHFQYLPMGGK